jgi:hypothetical protein
LFATIAVGAIQGGIRMLEELRKIRFYVGIPFNWLRIGFLIAVALILVFAGWCLCYWWLKGREHTWRKFKILMRFVKTEVGKYFW